MGLGLGAIEDSQLEYPGITERVKAAMIDGFLLVFFMFLITFTFSLFDEVSDRARMIAFTVILGVYDPLFTSFFGGTIGHMILKIRVVRSVNVTKNILLPLAFIRYFFKILLGWLSLLTVTGNQRKRAIHDMMGRSVVVYHSYSGI